MASKRYNMVVPIPMNSGDTFWHKIGAAWMNDKGQINIVFNSLPTPTENNGKWETRAWLFEATDDRVNTGQRHPATTRENKPWEDDVGDEIPF